MNLRRLLVTFIAAATAIGWGRTPVGAGPNLMAPAMPSSGAPTEQGPQKTIGDPKAPPHKMIVRRRGESPYALANRTLPSGARTMTRPLEMALPPLGKVMLILFEANPDAPVGPHDVNSIYLGWLLVPEGEPDHYRVELFPPITDGYGRLDYTIRSVFTADADGDGSPELCVLSEVNEVGSGDDGRPMYDTDIFKWSAGGFSLVSQDDKRPLDGLRNAKAVRARLKKILLEHPGGIGGSLR